MNMESKTYDVFDIIMRETTLSEEDQKIIAQRFREVNTETDNYYKGIIKKIATPYIEDLVSVVTGESAKAYYARGEVREIEEVQRIVDYLKGVSYGV